MQKFNCLIVEDEPLAAGILEDYIKLVPHLHLVAICSDALFALEALQKNQVDVIFLDVQLPRLKGLDFLKTLKDPPEIIITTAYHQYALEGYELDVLDYLLKPIEFSRFLKAVNKLSAKEIAVEKSTLPKERKYYFITVNKKSVRIWWDEILYIESVKDYVKIHLQETSYTTKNQIQKIDGDLRGGPFLRIHRSYLISLEKVTSFSATEIEIGNIKLPVGRSYRKQTLQVWESMRNRSH